MKSILVAALLLALPGSSLAAAPAPSGSAAGAAQAPAGARRLVDVNRAGAADLVIVPGIGERLAEAIVELRRRKGSFTRLEDLLEIRGIGEKSLAHLGEYLTVVQPAAPSSGGIPSPTK